jgi:isopentenyl-diphosphate delta-isomerase
METVILVDQQDDVIGTMEKMEAHKKGLLHRAFSILLFSSGGELLLQKRSIKKYHSGGLWTNACCSHPTLHESIASTARKRLKFEMGIDLQTQFAFKFIYRSELDKNLTEHEFDYVFTGIFDGTPRMNEDEVEDWKFIDIQSLRADLKTNPASYTAWFKLIINRIELTPWLLNRQIST